MSGAADWSGHPLVAPLRATLAAHRDAVLQAPPGAGKSTIVPLALLADPALAGRKILMLEPRRLATRAVAARLAANLGEPVGATVGYRMRLDTRVSRATRIEVITEGVLTRRLQNDPALEDVGWVIFDEFHERSLAADLGLALCLNARAQLEARFRLLAMSATLDGARVAELLGGAPIVNVPGRSFPVDLRYLGRGAPLLPGPDASPERFMAQSLRRALEETGGDVLAFLPGGGEIRRVQNLLQENPPPRTVVLPLFGDLGVEAQDLALRPDAQGRRRIILATNIAETSLTIEGVTVVVDSGLVRRSRFSPATGMSRLELMRISRASAEQRAGRAGRTAPGVCYRLWSEGAEASLAAYTPAEITEADLAPLALELAAWGTSEAVPLRWLDPPAAAPLAQARELLRQLGALDPSGRITAHGRELVELPLHPRLAHLLVAARAHDRVAEAAELAALLSERDLLRGPGGRDPDLRSRLALLHSGGSGGGDAAALQRARRQAERLVQQVEALPQPAHVKSGASTRSGASNKRGTNLTADSRAPVDVLALLALAYPDRIAQRRVGDEARYLLSGGRGALLRGSHSIARSDYLVAVELDDGDREARIDIAAPVSLTELEALCAEHIVERDVIAWDARTETVIARRERRLGELLLAEKPLVEVPAEAGGAAMLAGVRQMGLAALPWDESTRALKARLEFVRRLPAAARERAAGSAAWPASDEATLLSTLDEWLAPWIAGMTRRAHLARLPLGGALRARLDARQQRALEELAPWHFRAPTGSELRIDYEDDNAPCVEVRLQEVFGVATTPLLGGGAAPLTFKLLSPARRPVQITRDLAGFWRGSYAEVRKEMRGRYPKHYWPEDPLQAEPRRGTRPPSR